MAVMVGAVREISSNVNRLRNHACEKSITSPWVSISIIASRAANAAVIRSNSHVIFSLDIGEGGREREGTGRGGEGEGGEGVDIKLKSSHTI